MDKKEVIKEYMSELGKKSSDKRLGGKTKKEISEMMSQMAKGEKIIKDKKSYVKR
jgi:hypothetical protein